MSKAIYFFLPCVREEVVSLLIILTYVGQDQNRGNTATLCVRSSQLFGGAHLFLLKVTLYHVSAHSSLRFGVVYVQVFLNR